MSFLNPLSSLFGTTSKIEIEPFLAISNGKEVFVKGRVITLQKQSLPKAKNNSLSNIWAAIRRYSVTSIQGIQVIVSSSGKESKVMTDQDGVFECLLPYDGERNVNFRIDSKKDKYQAGPAQLRIDLIEASHGLISDIDDTILISHATEVGKKFWLSISKNAYTRRPFPGVSEFYHRLKVDGGNEVFYVSSSDWSLFDLIQDFLKYRNIPIGPILLKDKHINLKNIWKSGGGSHHHKSEKIRFLLDFFPEMKFILIGDSGQHDPEIYSEIKQEFSQRIKAVFIRQVDKKSADIPGRQQMKGELGFHFVQSTEEAIKIAESLNLFHP
ncbi:phosphatase domain-containing protein [Algoriphagus sp. PAP.12]|uniref:phosphatase domain-containing protein n=1 Tax=Algoriphagus sp. PAP.12 TaxID=2996678 RepID=UPI00227BE0AF|nr:phosphatase domain-containing protein [Algoriphagus sp. PAP.12]